jgi:hypothetical protein
LVCVHLGAGFEGFHLESHGPIGDRSMKISNRIFLKRRQAFCEDPAFKL